jgi:hypothetical protein
VLHALAIALRAQSNRALFRAAGGLPALARCAKAASQRLAAAAGPAGGGGGAAVPLLLCLLQLAVSVAGGYLAGEVAWWGRRYRSLGGWAGCPCCPAALLPLLPELLPQLRRLPPGLVAGVGNGAGLDLGWRSRRAASCCRWLCGQQLVQLG